MELAFALGKLPSELEHEEEWWLNRLFVLMEAKALAPTLVPKPKSKR